MTAFTATDHSVHDEPSGSRESGIVVRVAEREASPVASAMELGKNRDDEIDVDTDDGVAHAQRDVARGVVAHDAVARGEAGRVGEAMNTPEEAIIEVGDDEIETADPALSRQTMPSPSSALGSVRSRPPAPPSLRPRSASPRSSAPPFSSALPPPSRLSVPPSGNGRAAGVDPWLLANRTLELSRANARIVELEDQLAYREAVIVDLQDQLAKARRKLGEAQAAPPVASAPVVIAAVASAAAAPSERSLEAQPAASPTTASDVAAAAAVETAAAASDDDADEDFGEDGERESDFGNTPIASLGVRGGTPEEDLQQITGIGPRFEAALRKQGITRLSQIAAWSEADVRQVAKALRIPKSRIVKGGWVEAARQAIGSRSASE